MFQLNHFKSVIVFLLALVLSATIGQRVIERAQINLTAVIKTCIIYRTYGIMWI